MRSSTLLTLTTFVPAIFGGAVLLPRDAPPPESQEDFDHETTFDNENGLCRVWQKSSVNDLDTCAVYCKRKTDITCEGPGTGAGIPYYTAPNGDVYQMGKCQCSAPQIAKVLAEEVIKALPLIAAVACETIIDSLNLVLEVGAAAIPGEGEITEGMEMAVKAAKTIAENGQDAIGLAQWFGDPCNPTHSDAVANLTNHIDQIFDPLSTVANGIPGAGCVIKDKSACRKDIPDSPSTPKDKPDAPEPTPKKPDSSNPAPKPTSKPARPSSDKPAPASSKPASASSSKARPTSTTKASSGPSPKTTAKSSAKQPPKSSVKSSDKEPPKSTIQTSGKVPPRSTAKPSDKGTSESSAKPSSEHQSSSKAGPAKTSDKPSGSKTSEKPDAHKTSGQPPKTPETSKKSGHSSSKSNGASHTSSKPSAHFTGHSSGAAHTTGKPDDPKHTSTKPSAPIHTSGKPSDPKKTSEEPDDPKPTSEHTSSGHHTSSKPSQTEHDSKSTAPPKSDHSSKTDHSSKSTTSHSSSSADACTRPAGSTSGTQTSTAYEKASTQEADLCKIDKAMCGTNDYDGGDDGSIPDGSPSAKLRRRTLEKRGGYRNFSKIIPDDPGWIIKSAPYPELASILKGGSYTGSKKRYDFASTDLVETKITSRDMVRSDIKTGKEETTTILEHILELQTIMEFIRYCISGDLPSLPAAQKNDPPKDDSTTAQATTTGGTTTSPTNRPKAKPKPKKNGKTTTPTKRAANIPASFFEKNWNNPVLKGVTPSTYGKGSSKRDGTKPNDRIFEAMGSSSNSKHFVICESKLNSLKALVWGFARPRDSTIMKAAITKSSEAKSYDESARGGTVKPGNNTLVSEWMSYIKLTVGVFDYLNDPTVSKNIQDTVDDVRTELALIEKNIGGDAVGLAAKWDEFIPKYFAAIEMWGKSWAVTWLKYAEAEFTKAKQQLDEDAKKKNQCSGAPKKGGTAAADGKKAGAAADSAATDTKKATTDASKAGDTAKKADTGAAKGPASDASKTPASGAPKAASTGTAQTSDTTKTKSKSKRAPASQGKRPHDDGDDPTPQYITFTLDAIPKLQKAAAGISFPEVTIAKAAVNAVAGAAKGASSGGSDMGSGSGAAKDSTTGTGSGAKNTDAGNTAKKEDGASGAKADAKKPGTTTAPHAKAT